MDNLKLRNALIVGKLPRANDRNLCRFRSIRKTYAYKLSKFLDFGGHDLLTCGAAGSLPAL